MPFKIGSRRGAVRLWPEGFRGRIASARWQESRIFTDEAGARETGPSLLLTIERTDKFSPDLQRVRLGLGSSIRSYEIRDDGRFFFTDQELNPNCTFMRFYTAMEILGVDLDSERFWKPITDETGLTRAFFDAEGLIGLHFDYVWKDEVIEFADGRKVTRTLLLPTKRHPDIGAILHTPPAIPEKEEISEPLQLSEEELKDVKTTILLFCEETPRTRLQIIEHCRKQGWPEYMVALATSSVVIDELIASGNLEEKAGGLLITKTYQGI